MSDWTMNPETKRSNDSAAFYAIVKEVERLLRGTYLGDDLESRARLIVAHLAHVHGLAPTGR